MFLLIFLDVEIIVRCEYCMDPLFPFEFLQPKQVSKDCQVPLNDVWDYAPLSEVLLVGNGSECMFLNIIFLL